MRMYASLHELLNGFVDATVLQSHAKLQDIMIADLVLDSRKAANGSLFFALPGETVNGVEFVNQAINNGAAAVLWDCNETVDAITLNWHGTVPVIAVAALAEKAGLIADRFYQHASRYITVCGITGTNGKTSCADFIAQAITRQRPCGLMGTLGKGIYPALQPTGYTTPDAITCHQWLAELHADKVTDAVMEVSSHALQQGRVNGIAFDSAVFTNLTRDHLDYHGDMQAYIDAKAKLFAFPGLHNAIINSDDHAGRAIANKLDASVNCIRYGVQQEHKPDVYAEHVQLDTRGICMQVTTPWGKGKVQTSLLGDFNVSNLLAVLSVLLVQGMEFDKALQSLAELKSVAGRMQRFGGEQQPLVIVDFAHTPDALQQVLSTLRAHTRQSLWVVFGCGGDRDKGKRPLMGKIAEQQADRVVLTNDNPRSESAECIIQDIVAGMQNKSAAAIIPDRHDAIHFAISQAQQDDIVVVAGKGHEDYQIIGEQRIAFSDADEVQQQLARYAG